MANRLLQVPMRTLKSVGRMADADQEIQKRALEIQHKGTAPLPEQSQIHSSEEVVSR
jgi:hypothetical protein